jgi:hypothetical protein
VTVLEDLAPPPKVEVWLAAIAALEGLPYATILPGHGQPGDRGLYGDTRAYLTAARAAVAEADGLNRYLIAAFPATAAPPCSGGRTTSFTRAIANA